MGKSHGNHSDYRMPAVVLAILKNINQKEIAKAWRSILSIRCIFGKKKCDPFCEMCHKSLAIQYCLYPDLQTIGQGQYLFSIRTPQILKIPQVFTISKMLYRLFRDRVSKIIIPLSSKEKFYVIQKGNRVLFQGNVRKSINLKLQQENFPPPYKLTVTLKRKNVADVINNLDIEISKLLVTRGGNRVLIKIITHDSKTPLLRFKKVEYGIITGNPRIYSKNRELFQYLLVGIPP